MSAEEPPLTKTKDYLVTSNEYSEMGTDRVWRYRSKTCCPRLARSAKLRASLHSSLAPGFSRIIRQPIRCEKMVSDLAGTARRFRHRRRVHSHTSPLARSPNNRRC